MADLVQPYALPLTPELPGPPLASASAAAAAPPPVLHLIYETLCLDIIIGPHNLLRRLAGWQR